MPKKINKPTKPFVSLEKRLAAAKGYPNIYISKRITKNSKCQWVQGSARPQTDTPTLPGSQAISALTSSAELLFFPKTIKSDSDWLANEKEDF